MRIDVVAFDPSMEPAWDQFCIEAINGTFQHTRSFIGYHGDRFKDISVLLMKDKKILGVFPAAIAPEDDRMVVSHPGATYGGIVHQGQLLGNSMIDAVTALKTHYSDLGYSKLLYKVLPYIYSSMAAQDDLYALYRHNANRIRCDLSCCIDLINRRKVSSRRKRGLKKALKTVALSKKPELLRELWSVIAQNLSRRHSAQPVHSAEELELLIERFPNNLVLHCGLIDDRVEAGVLFFNTPTVWHAQYIASSERGYEISALDAVFDAAITDASKSGGRYFDFGTSNENNGRVLNDGLYTFKSEFGGSGVAHEYYELSLNK